MNYATKANVKPGTLLCHAWGATMLHHNFFQVIEVKGSKVKLGVPICRAEGNQEGYEWIEAACPNPEYVRNAKFVGDELRLCGKPGEKTWDGKSCEWKQARSWASLTIQEIGKKEHFYGD